MTHKINNTVFIYEEPDDICEFCGKIDELRPYGPNKEKICFPCAMKDEKTTSKQFNKILNGEVN